MSSRPDITRGSGGRFAAGKSPNPGGRPKTSSEVAELAREKSPQAIERLLQIGMSGRSTAAVLALREILDRGLGKPPVAVAVTARAAIPGAVVGRARQQLEELVAAEETRRAAALAAIGASTDVATDGETVAFDEKSQAPQVLAAGGLDGSPTVVPRAPETGGES